MTINEYSLHALTHITPTWASSFFPAFDVHATVLIRQHFEYSIEALVNGTTQILANCKIATDGLEEMADTLFAIHDIAAREHALLSNERDDLADSFWTRLGGNQDRLGGLGQRLVLIGGIANYRAKALKHVRQTMNGVLSIQEDVSHIRTKAALVDRPISQLTTQDMKLQLYGIKAAMARIAEGMEESRKKNQKLERGAMVEWGIEVDV